VMELCKAMDSGKFVASQLNQIVDLTGGDRIILASH
jgi:hypothetical protein